MLRFAIAFVLATGSLVAQVPAGAPATPRPAPAPLMVPEPHYVTLILTQDVKVPVDTLWSRVGKYCDIGEWAFQGCTLLSGDGNVGSARSVVREALVGQTKYSYTYAQPVRTDAKYNLYHGTLEAQSTSAKTSRLVYSFIYDNSMLADDAARDTELAARRARFTGYLRNMKTLAEGGKLPAGTLTPVPIVIPQESLQAQQPHYVTIPMTITVNAPADKVWARVGKYCDIGEWGIPGCSIVSGDGGLGTVRTIGSEVLVGKTPLSYTYTQPVRVGPTYNMYHGTLEAVALSPATTRLNYTLFFDNSMLADDAARAKDMDTRRTRFTKMLENMKVLGEGGTLPPGALPAAARPAPAR